MEGEEGCTVPPQQLLALAAPAMEQIARHLRLALQKPPADCRDWAENLLEGPLWDAVLCMNELEIDGFPLDLPDFEGLQVPDCPRARLDRFRELAAEALACTRDPARHRHVRTPLNAACLLLSHIAHRPAGEPPADPTAEATPVEGGA